MVMGRGFARDLTHDPWGSVEPEWKQDGGPLGPVAPALAHDASPEVLADPRSLEGRAADNAQEIAQPGYTVGPADLGSMIQQLTSNGPVVTLLAIGAAGALLIGLLGRGGPVGAVGRGAQGVGRATARTGGAVNSGARGVGGSALDGVNGALGSLTEALDKATPGR